MAEGTGIPAGAPNPADAYKVIEEGAGVYRMTFLVDVEASSPAVAKFRTHNLFDAVFGMMNPDQGVRLKCAIAGGDAAQWIRGVTALGDTETVSHPFDLEAFERQRAALIALASGEAGADSGSPSNGEAIAGEGHTDAPRGQERTGDDADADERDA